MKNYLLELEKHGQSIWLDFISRKLLKSGELEELIKNDGLKGLTSNPSIFEKAIAKTQDYDQEIYNFTGPAYELYEKLAIKDIQEAADHLRVIFDQTKGLDGFVSLEVSPGVAHDAQKTIQEGLSLWHTVNRPNLMIKVPGTQEGMEAVRVLTSKGVNINITLLFSVDSYEKSAQAYLAGLSDRVKQNLDIKNIQSVASFFISRIDSKIDEKLENLGIKNLQGKAAIANAKLAYKAYEKIYNSELAKKLLAQGAHPQRLLWASTSTKNKNYSDILYVSSLIAPNTVNTLPPATLEAFRDHGHVSDEFIKNLDDGQNIMSDLKNAGIDFSLCCEELLTEGLKLFSDAFDQLLEAIEHKLAQKKK